MLMICPNFLGSYILTDLATHEKTCIYQFNTKNDTSFFLWWNDILLNYLKISQYYEHEFSAQSFSQNKKVLSILARNFWKRRHWNFLVYCYFIWKLVSVWNISPMIVFGNNFLAYNRLQVSLNLVFWQFY